MLRMGQGMLWSHSGGQGMLCDRDSTALRMQEPPNEMGLMVLRAEDAVGCGMLWAGTAVGCFPGCSD